MVNSSVLGRVTLLVISIALTKGWEALDPEQVLFGFSRCGEDFTPNDDSREIRIKNWAVWKLEPLDNWTMCYVRCCLERLELFDANTNQFVPERVSIQHQAYKKYNELKESEVQDFAAALNSIPAFRNCESVYTTLFKQLIKYVPTIMKPYHGSPTLNKKIYEDLKETIRQKKQPYTEFCENKHKLRGSQAICEFRKFGSTKNSAYEEVIDCIFKGFRYLDKDCNIDVNEIIRDFHAINEKQLDDHIKQVISNCQVSSATRASDYYDCLRSDNRLQDKFRSAFQYREVRSADYDYAFQIPGPPVYNAASVKEKADIISKKQCLEN